MKARGRRGHMEAKDTCKPGTGGSQGHVGSCAEDCGSRFGGAAIRGLVIASCISNVNEHGTLVGIMTYKV